MYRSLAGPPSPDFIEGTRQGSRRRRSRTRATAPRIATSRRIIETETAELQTKSFDACWSLLCLLRDDFEPRLTAQNGRNFVGVPRRNSLRAADSLRAGRWSGESFDKSLSHA